MAAKTASSRAEFAKQAYKWIVKYKFDGIDINWEYPGFEDGKNPGEPEDVENYVHFIKKLKTYFSSKSTESGKELLVTAAVGAPASRRKHSYPKTKEICDILDYIHLMTYDFHGGWENVMGHHS